MSPTAQMASSSAIRRPGDLGQRQADEPGEGEVEQRLAGEGPGDGVPEGGEHRAPALEQERGEDDAGEELAVGVGVPLAR